MNNIKGCRKTLGIVVMLFVFGLCSQLMTGLGNAAEDSAALSDTIWCVDCGIYKIYGNARAGFLRNYECTDCLDCFYLKSQNPINTINLSQNEILNQCFDCWTMLNELENVSMVLN